MKEKLYRSMKELGLDIDYDTFSYGSAVCVQYLLFLIITLPVIIIFKLYLETLTFLVFFIFLRRYNGGFHFDNKYFCLISSVIISIIFPHLSVQLQFNFFHYLSIIICIIFFTYFLGVVDHKNKILSEKKKNYI